MPIAQRAPEISSPSGGSVGRSFKRAVAKVKPSRTGRPRQAAQLLPVPEAALLTQELAPEATSNLGLHGWSAVDHTSRP